MALDAESLRKLHPLQYHQQFLGEGKREDGRTDLLQTRSVNVACGTISTVEGSSMVRIGKTTVCCGIKAEIASPEEDYPRRGYFVPKVELPSMCGPEYHSQRKSEEGQATAEIIHSLFVYVTYLIHYVNDRNKIFDLEDLCVEEKAMVWTLYADVVCLNHDGSLIPAAVLAVEAALKSLRIPKVWRGEDERVLRSKDAPLSLDMKNIIGCVEFAQVCGHVIADPTKKEEEVADWTLVVGKTKDGKVCLVEKPGGTPISREQMQVCMRQSQSVVAEMIRAL